MRADGVVTNAVPTGDNAAPKEYLHAVIAVARSARRPEYAVVHFGSGSFLRTDRLGAMVMRAMIDGRSAAEAAGLAEGIEAGAGERARRLIGGLAATQISPSHAGGRQRLRRLAALATGLTFGVVGPMVRWMPAGVLASMFRILPSTPIARHVWRSNRVTILNNLRASGYSGGPELTDISRRCAAGAPRNRFFMYLSIMLSRERLVHFLDRVFDRDSVDEVATSLETAGPAVGVFLHGPLCVAVPNVLRARGHEVVRSLVPMTHGIYVSERAGPLRGFFGDSPEMAVEVTDPLASVTLLRHLKAGRSIYVALDDPARERKPAAEIEMLGHRFPRNDGPAWLAVRSGRPIALWTTSASPSGVVIKTAPFLYPDPSLPVERRVAALSERLYGYAEAAIREHPEAWSGWSYLSEVKGSPIE